MIRSLDGNTPNIQDSAYVNEMAYVIGKVEIGEGSSVWPSAVVRGDGGLISIGKNTHVQDGSILHCYGGLQIGDNVNIGHSVVVHCSKIGNRCLIGNNATLLEEVELGDYCLIGANAMILKGTKIPSNSFVFGVPGEIHPLTDKQHEMLNMVTRAFERLIAMYKKNGV